MDSSKLDGSGSASSRNWYVSVFLAQDPHRTKMVRPDIPFLQRLLYVGPLAHLWCLKVNQIRSHRIKA
jgi:hypothetical protein